MGQKPNCKRQGFELAFQGKETTNFFKGIPQDKALKCKRTIEKPLPKP